MNGKLVVAVTVAVVLGGCAGPDVPQSAASAAGPTSATSAAPPPSLPVAPLTSAPPNGPTDQIKKTDWVVGTVTGDSSGPCYGLETDDGTQYALHSTAGTKLVKGRRMRIKTAPMLVRMYCGPGTHREMVAAERL
ncbi:hypothetical protein GCM10010172_01080 [Paractinoplanes ferrugineus]|uniref:Uncharacterized protein n=1 Tax=Paractinoplanes ferrugineus TaxID=113564 RepID=A0A919J4X2_9ACTN|nr:hypothetical protein [Actinoplanes ferrugineus]GIE13955.1 hypothetical protein Afe05nite_57950 [Actinoplanes ferrugineus]